MTSSNPPGQVTLSPVAFANANAVAAAGAVKALTENLAYAVMQIEEMKAQRDAANEIIKEYAPHVEGLQAYCVRNKI